MGIDARKQGYIHIKCANFSRIMPNISHFMREPTCDFTHPFAATGSITLPRRLYKSLFYNTSLFCHSCDWKHRVAESTKWKHTLAVSTCGVLIAAFGNSNN